MRRGVSQPAIDCAVLLAGVSEEGAEGRVSDDLDLDLAYLDDLPEPTAPATLRVQDLYGCRWIAGEPWPIRRGMWCGKPTRAGTSWCDEHHRVAFGRAKRRGAS